MTEQERAVIAAARAWAKGGQAESRALLEAVRRLDENTCPAQGIGGDPAWPVSLSCERTAGHAVEYHKDPVYGEWRKRS